MSLDKPYEVLRRYNAARDEVRRLHATNGSKASIDRAQKQRDALESVVVQLLAQGMADP